MKQYAFGIDVGGTTVKMGFFTAAGELLEKMGDKDGYHGSRGKCDPGCGGCHRREIKGTRDFKG